MLVKRHVACMIVFGLVFCFCAGCDGVPQYPTPRTKYSRFCDSNNAPARRTVLIIDNNTPFDDTLSQQFDDYLIRNITYMSHEETTIFLMDSAQGTMHQVAFFCYPGNTPQKPKNLLDKILDLILGGDSINISAAVADFERNFFKPVMARILDIQKKIKNGSFAQNKLILEAIESNASLLADKTKISRVIIYSDMLQHLDGLSTQQLSQNNISFYGARFYIFGKGSSLPVNDPRYVAVERFWRKYLISHFAHLEDGWYSDNLRQDNPILSLNKIIWKGAIRKQGPGNSVDIPITVRWVSDDKGRVVYSGLYIDAAPSDGANGDRVKGFIPLSGQPCATPCQRITLATTFFEHDDLLPFSRLELAGITTNSVTGSLVAKTRKGQVIYDVKLAPN